MKFAGKSFDVDYDDDQNDYDDYTITNLSSLLLSSSLCDISLPFSCQYLSNDDCLKDNREDDQNCSVLYCVNFRQLNSSTTAEQFLKLTVGLRLAFCMFLPFCSCVVVFLLC